MSFRSIKPFFVEMITFLFVTTTIFIGLLVCNLIEVYFYANILTISVVGLILVLFISLFSKTIPIGIRATCDFLSQNVQEDTYVFLKIQPYRASIFTERFTTNHERSYGMYYLIQTKKENQIHTFISSAYVDLIEGKTYLISSGRSSNIFLNSKSAV